MIDKFIDMCEISIIIPVYNCEKYIGNMINSILNQTFNNYELILINDGSKDNTQRVIESYTDSRIKIINKENEGASIARNIGIGLAKGKYLTFFDADDYLEPNMLEKLFFGMISYDFDLGICGYYMERVDENFNVINNVKLSMSSKKYINIQDFKNDFVSLWDASLMYNVWNKIYKKEIIDKNNILFKEMIMGEDVYFNEEYLRYVSKVNIIEDTLYHYIRERNGSITTDYVQYLFEFRKKEYIDMQEYFLELDVYDRKGKEYVARRFAERIIGCIENEFKSNCAINQRMKNIKKIILDSQVQEAISHTVPTSNKVAIMLSLIKSRNTILIYGMGFFIYFFKKVFPRLFFIMKANR